MNQEPASVPVAKKVSVVMDNREPRFVFEGDWTGHDVIVVRSTLRRAYLTHQRGLRRDEAISNPTIGAQE